MRGGKMKADTCFKLFGRYISYSVEKEQKFGRLIQVRIDLSERMLVGIDENGFIEEYEINAVHIMTNDSRKNLTSQIIKQVNRDINSFKFDLCEYRKDDIIECLKKVNNEFTRDRIISGLDMNSKAGCCTELYQLVREQNISDEEKDIVCGAIAYKQHDYEEAYRIFSSRWLENKIDIDACRDFILVADEFNNDVLCFYLLNEFFKNNSKYINNKYHMNLWWKYLYYAVKYNNFDLILQIDITSWNVRWLIDSYIYIFHMYNLEHLAVGLTDQFVEGNNTILQRNNEDLGNIAEAIAELNLCKNYLPETVESYYLRFKICMEKILDAYTSGKVEKLDEEKAGYIYEYVKSRNYGFIIGFDFQKYFYHLDYMAQNLKNRVMDNIYSDKAIEEEDKIYVQFRCENINKKVQAIDII